MGSIGPVMLDIESTELTEADRELLANPSVGGLIIFSRNIESAEQVLNLTKAIKAINPQIIIAVDQEGGRVQRLVDGFTPLPPLSHFGKLAELDLEKAQYYAKSLGELMALEVQSVGCDISFAPVLDLGFEESRVIGNRAFSTEPKKVILLGGAYLDGMRSAGMLGTGKHFPGHGSVEADSHHEVPVDSRREAEIKQLDLVPFEALSQSLGAVMPAHIIYSAIDSVPAGFSETWLKQILRKQLQFKGVIFSDDLSMKGAETAGNFAQRTDAALTAGCDMVLVCNDRKAAGEVLESLADKPLCEVSGKRLRNLLSTKSPTGLAHLKQTKRWNDLHEDFVAFKEITKEFE